MADMEYSDAEVNLPPVTAEPAANADIVADGDIDTTGIDVAATPVDPPDGPPVSIGVVPAAPAVAITPVPDLEPETAGEVIVPAPSAPSSTFVASFNGRTGAVTPAVGDYTDAKVTNTSSLPGATVKAALDSLAVVHDAVSEDGGAVSITGEVNIYFWIGANPIASIDAAGLLMDEGCDILPGTPGMSDLGDATGGWGDIYLQVGKVIKVDNKQVLGGQGAAVADATGPGDIVAQFNTLLERCRAHGLIAT
jgi:hypothetical protein